MRLFWKLFFIYAGLAVVLTAAFLVLESIWHPPSAAGLADQDQSRWWMIVLSCGATALAIVAGYFVIRNLVGPLSRLSAGALQIELDEDADELPASDEFGLLGTALAQMKRQLARQVEELQENSQRLSTVLGSMVEGVIAVGFDERILLANEASRRLLDVTIVNPVGRSLLEVSRNLAVHEVFTAALHSRSPVEREIQSLGPARRVLSLRAVRLPGNPCPGVMIVLHDVSELRKLENLRREFVANVSHELKTPLASIQAYAETLKLGALNDPTHAAAFVARIEEQAERLHQLILDLIQVARMESGEETFEIVEVDLAEVVQDAMEQFAPAAAARQITLVAEPVDREVIARTDPEGVRTMLDNLVDNAIKYTPPGGNVVIRCREEANQAILEVQDSGIGIAEQDQARIFERFYRVDRARSRELGGTGLGLSIVKHLAQALGGSVHVESRLRRGSTFRIHLPLQSTPAQRPARLSL